jgi:hypothetical protein
MKSINYKQWYAFSLIDYSGYSGDTDHPLGFESKKHNRLTKLPFFS